MDSKKIYQTINMINLFFEYFLNIYLKIKYMSRFFLMVYTSEMERTQPWLSFPGSEIKIHRVVVELEHFENSILYSIWYSFHNNLLNLNKNTATSYPAADGTRMSDISGFNDFHGWREIK